MPESGPQPESDREFLVQIYQMLKRQDDRLESHGQIMGEHGARLERLEETASKVEGGFVLVKFTLAAVAPIGALAGWLGVKLT